ncbi:MAG TPA: hypothetical protein PKX12_13610 [Spirochaetota bacterium]|nr:hypothetical protein [Spirochaetota bacterium]
MNTNRKVVFAGDVFWHHPNDREKENRDMSGGREYRSEMFSTYRDMCQKHGLTPMSREDFTNFGFSKEQPQQARRRHISEYWGWMI